MAMELFAAPGREDAVEEMLDTFVPDYDSLGDDSTDGEEEKPADGATEEMADSADFLLKPRESITHPDLVRQHARYACRSLGRNFAADARFGKAIGSVDVASKFVAVPIE